VKKALGIQQGMEGSMATSRRAGAAKGARELRAGKGAAEAPEVSAGTVKAGAAKEKKGTKREKLQYAEFRRLENRQKAVEQNRRAVFAHLDEITGENIKLAKKGNSAIARFLFEFAGINQVPAQVTTSKAKKRAAGGEEKMEDDPTKAVRSFYKKLGITPPRLKPPKVVEEGEQEQEQASAG
jgi:hypothetical protein